MDSGTTGELLSVIGLGCDIVGAIVLAIVLFQRTAATYDGGKTLDHEARDMATGTVGGLFLSIGFVLQLLPHLGAGPNGSNTDRVLALVATVIATPLIALALHRLFKRGFLVRIERSSRANS